MVGTLSVNQTLHEKASGKDIRILYLSPDRSYLYWIDLDKKGGMPVKGNPEEFEESLLQGTWQTVADTWTAPVTSSDKGLARRDALWEALGPSLQAEPDIFEREKRGSLLKEASEKTGIAVTNLYPLMKQYWRLGKVRDAFIPADSNKGGKGKARTLSSNTGPKPSADAEASKVLTEEDFEIFAEYAKRYVRKGALRLIDVYDDMVRERYSDVIIASNGMKRVVSYGQGRTPTYRQFYYWYSKHRDRNAETVGRKGTSEMNLKERASLGKADFRMQGPGAQYQIDATIADVYLVSRFNRANIIGRPVVYFVKDAASRMPVGLYVGLEGPSWMGMAMALYNAFSDKVSFCHKYGIEITEEDWPCHHLPHSLIGDRGELEGEDGARIAEKLGIQVDNTPPYRGDLKPIIERHFRILNDQAVHRLPGNVRPDLSQRGGRDYRLDAVLDLHQFTRIIIFETLTFIKLTLKDLEPSEDMMRAGIELTPLSLWRWGINNQAGALRILPEETVRLVLLPEGSGETTRYGFKFKKLFYSCEEAIKEQWFEDANRGKARRRKVSYDPRDASAIYIWNEDCSSAVKAELLDWEAKFVGKSIDECEYEMEIIDCEKAKRKKKDKDAILTADGFLESIVEEAKAMKPDLSGTTKTQRTAAIPDNREEEKQAQTKEESLVHQKEPQPQKPNGDPQDAKPAVRGKRELTQMEKLVWGEDPDDEE